MSDDFRIEDMTEQECWATLDRERFGRLAVAVHGEPDIFPVNFIVDGNGLLMRTAAGTKLTELVNGAQFIKEAVECRQCLFLIILEGKHFQRALMS